MSFSILILDNSINHRVIEDYLSKSYPDIKIYACENVQTTFNTLQRFDINLILFDVNFIEEFTEKIGGSIKPTCICIGMARSPNLRIESKIIFPIILKPFLIAALDSLIQKIEINK
jgi:two-component SAPR family response regulator